MSGKEKGKKGWDGSGEARRLGMGSLEEITSQQAVPISPATGLVIDSCEPHFIAFQFHDESVVLSLNFS